MGNVYPNLWKILFQQKENYKNKPIITFGEHEIYFLELIEKIQKVSSYLNNAKSEEVVCIHLDNPISNIICVLGALVSNRAYWIVNKIILNSVDNEILDGVLIINNEVYKNLLKSDDTFNYQENINFDSPFCWTTSSGSLSKPKITEHTYQSIFEETYRQIKAHGITNKDRIDILSSLSFSASLSSIFPAIFSGASIHIKNLNSEIESIYDFWRIQRITMTTIIPSVFRSLMKLKLNFRDLEIRFICLGGEKVSFNDISLFQKKFNSKVTIQAALASSETRTIAEYIANGKSTVPPKGSIPYKPIKDKKLLIVDEDLKELSAGNIGRIVIQSKIIGKRYVNDKGNFQCLQNKDRIFISEDFGKLMNNGDLKIQDRHSRRTKLKGEYVDLDMVESMILSHKDIIDCYVFLNQKGNELQLILYSKQSKDKLKKWIYKTLNNFPFRLYLMDSELPKLPSGKRDLKKAKEILYASFESQNISNDNNFGIYKALKEIFPEHNDFNGKHFFKDLGGDSFRAVEFAVMASNIFDTDIDSDIAYQFPLIDELETNLLKKKTVKLVTINEKKDLNANILIFPWIDGSISAYSQIIESFSEKYNIYKILFQIREDNRYISTNQIAINISKYLNSLDMTFSFFIGHSYAGIISYISAHHSKLTNSVYIIDTPTFKKRNNLEKFILKIVDKVNFELRTTNKANDLKELYSLILNFSKKKLLHQNKHDHDKNDSIQKYFDEFFDFNSEVNNFLPSTDFKLGIFQATNQNMFILPDYKWKNIIQD